MIASLEGTLEGLGKDFALVKVGGVSFKVQAPTSTLASLGPGGEGERVKLYTHLYLREEVLALYGFASPEELGLFETLLGVTGVGPKLALALLSALSPDRLAEAIASGDVETLDDVPGLGKKTAGRLILELKDKLKGAWAAAGAGAPRQANREALEVLVSLGYSVREAEGALSTVPNPNLPLEEKVRLALQHLGRR
ncbi:MAG: Holliday junction branch migration protein RuvA [Chloroflexota bacterium]|nr:Holliday junction branch migration protein RuvA [Chloroflexota bacterium]